MIARTPYTATWDELAAEKSMVFLSGPRQSGKTTLARMIAERFPNRVYFNWDIVTDRRRLVENPYFFEEVVRHDESRPLVIFDEIHKRRGWKNYLKGVFDRFHDDFLFLVTGSGRLDTYQRGGDSLAGRYYAFHLWPLTLAELHYAGSRFDEFASDPLGTYSGDAAAAEADWERLAMCSGFPEPYLAARRPSYRRWSTTYRRQLIREDIRDLTGVTRIDEIELLFALLPSKVGAPLSIPSLATDLKAAYNTVKAWLRILDRFYLTFTITPWAREISRAVHMNRKTYLFDYASVEDAGARFENMVALELHRAVTSWTDLGWGEFGLHYIRTKEGREVDFLVTRDRRPMLLVETRLGDTDPSANLRVFQKALGVPAVQLTGRGDGFIRTTSTGGPLLVAPVWRWIQRLP